MHAGALPAHSEGQGRRPRLLYPSRRVGLQLEEFHDGSGGADKGLCVRPGRCRGGEANTQDSPRVGKCEGSATVP